MTQPTLVYLDQNRWIELTRAYFKLPRGEKYSTTLSVLSDAVKNGKVILPLSSIHILELNKTADIDHRKRIATVMTELSNGRTLAPASYLLPNQLEKAIAKTFNYPLPSQLSALGHGVLFAFGITNELHEYLGVTNERAEVVRRILNTPEGFFAMLAGIDENLVQASLSFGKRYSDEVTQNIERFRQLGKAYSKTMRKRAYAVNVTLALQSKISRALAVYSITSKEFLDPDKNNPTLFFQSVPCLDVEVELATERNEFWNKPLEPNDMADIGFLQIAIPYCDIVVTEKLWVDLARRKNLDKKYNTEMANSLADLMNRL